MYTGEILYDHIAGGAFNLTKPYPIDQQSSNKRKFDSEDITSIENESKDHMEPPVRMARYSLPQSSSNTPIPTPPPPPPPPPTSTNHRTLQVAKNFLTLQSQKHANWLFGGIAELIHNASDAGATRININHFYDIAHNNDNVLEIYDNGSGMSPITVGEILLSFGRDYDPNERDIERIGCYGVGFKQGSIRIGSTVIFVTKYCETNTISIGILCNKPYEDSHEMFIYEHATLSYPTFRVDERYCTEYQYEKTTKYMNKYSFLNRENISSLIQKHFTADTSGTIVFIQHWRKGFDRLEYDQEMNDFRLYSNLTTTSTVSTTTSGAGGGTTTSGMNQYLFRQSGRETIDRSVPIWIDCSLKEYLQYMFYKTNIQIFIGNELIPSIRIDSELSQIQRVDLLSSTHGMSPVSGYIGKSKKWEKQKIGGAMLYGSNCLIRSFVRSDIGLTIPSEGWGVVLVVNIPVGITSKGCGINTTQDKQNFEGNCIYIKLLQRIAHEYRLYLNQTEFPLEINPIGTSHHTSRSNWIQCEQCGKWRRVSEEIEQKFLGTIPFYCYHQNSPIMVRILQREKINNERTRRMACETPEEDYSDEMTQSITTGYETNGDRSTSTSSSTSLSLTTSLSTIKIEPPSNASSSRIIDESDVLVEPSSQSSNPDLDHIPDLYYTLHHPAELEFNWKGEIASLHRMEPINNIPSNYDSLYAHILGDETNNHYLSPYYTCTSDILYAIYLSYLQYERYQQRFPILKISSEYLDAHTSGENLFNLSTMKGLEECQSSRRLTTKQLAVISSKCRQRSMYILKGKIPSHAILGIYNPFPITLTSPSHGSTSSATTTSSRGITIRQSISRLNSFLQISYQEWLQQAHIIFTTQSMDNLFNEMKISYLSDTSTSSIPVKSSSSWASNASILNEFHLKIQKFFEISSLFPFWLSDYLMKILLNLFSKKYNNCSTLVNNCYHHPLWNSFLQEKSSFSEEKCQQYRKILKVYKEEIREILKKNEVISTMECIKDLKQFFNLLKS